MDRYAHLETFVAVADAGGMTRAAQALGLPQPLVSRRIQSLERTWGVELFERTPRGPTLTALGQVALPYARDVVQRMDRLEQAVATARAGTVHRLGIPPGCPPRALARLIEVAAGRGVTIALHEAAAAARREGLADGRLSAAMLRSAPVDGGPRVATGLARAPDAADAAHPSGRPVHLDSLRPRRGAPAPGLLITGEDDLEPFAGALRRAAARAGVSATAIRSVASPVAAAAEVLAGGGALLCDARTAAETGLHWAALADRSLHRGYELEVGAGAGAGLGRDTLAALSPVVTEAIGARIGSMLEHADGATAGGDERLAARGA